MTRTNYDIHSITLGVLRVALNLNAHFAFELVILIVMANSYGHSGILHLHLKSLFLIATLSYGLTAFYSSKLISETNDVSI